MIAHLQILCQKVDMQNPKRTELVPRPTNIATRYHKLIEKSLGCINLATYENVPLYSFQVNTLPFVVVGGLSLVLWLLCFGTFPSNYLTAFVLSPSD